jgi:predicted transcriptional regulator of viral defense system
MKSTDAYSILSAAGHVDPVDIETVAGTLGLSRSQASDTVSRMVTMGLATRIRRGLVLLKPPAEIGTPTLGEDAYTAALALTDPAQSYLGFYTALHRHGQVIRPAATVFVATTRRRRSRVIGGTRIRYVTIDPKRLFGIEISNGLPWSDPERTLLDGLARPEYCGRLDVVVGAFHGYGSNLNVERFRTYLGQYGMTSVAKRGEYVLERLGLGNDSEPAPLAVRRLRHYIPLDPSGPTTGEQIPQWEVIDNIPPRAWHGD